jgi:lysophospholipase L1-like esterase
MVLDPVVLGGPHVAAHNAERAVINDHDTKITNDIPASISAVAGLPSYVGSRSKLFDPSLSLYNSNVDKLRFFRAAAARARKGGTLRITCIGDSTTAGSGADHLNSYPMQLRAMLAASGAPIKGTGAVFAGQGITDPRWTSTGTNTSFGSYCQLSAGATRTFTSDLPGDTVVLRFYRNSGNWTIKVDGAFVPAAQVDVVGGTYNDTTGTITPDGTNAVGSVTITGLTSTTHAVLATAVGTFYYISIKVELSTVTGISVSNMGVASTKTSNWTPTGFVSNYQMATAEPADLFIVALGINDNNTIAPATTAANLNTLITNLLTIAPVLVVAQHNNFGFTAAQQQVYVSAIYDTADSLNLPLIDLMYHWGSYFNMNSWGLTADTVHPNSKGYNDWASTIYAAAVLGNPITVSASNVVPPVGTPAGYVLQSKADGTTEFVSPGSPKVVIWDGTGGQPARPVTLAGIPVFYICPVVPTGGGTVNGGTGKVDGLDILLKVPT